MGEQASVHITLLGAVAVEGPAGTTRPKGVQPALLLAALAVARPHPLTRDELVELLSEAPVLAPHLEVETYTFDVLPLEYRSRSVTEAVARELAWTLGMLARRSSRNEA